MDFYDTAVSIGRFVRNTILALLGLIAILIGYAGLTFAMGQRPN